MKRILVAVDLSVFSVNALEYGIMMANQTGAETDLLYVIKEKPNYYPEFQINRPEEAPEIIQSKLDFLVGKFQGMCKGKILTAVRTGKVYSEIVRHAKETEADIIVIGTHGVSGPDERWAGSNTLKVISSSPCPVISVPVYFIPQMPKKIVLPVDTSPESRQKIPFVTSLAKIFGSEIHLITIASKSNSFQMGDLSQLVAQSKDFITNKGVSCIHQIKIGNNPAIAAGEYAHACGADLIAIMTDQTGDLSIVWIGAHAQQIINKARIPVLSLNPF